MTFTLYVDDTQAKPSPDFVLRFCYEKGVLVPVLYHKGKRVTQGWNLFMYASQKEQPSESVNVAEPIGVTP